MRDDEKRKLLDGAANEHDREAVMFWVCGTSGRSLEEEWGLQLSLDDERRLREEQRDGDRAAACPLCADVGTFECLDAEFDEHDEETCRYGCQEGAVPCHRCEAGDPTWRDEAPPEDDEALDLVELIAERQAA